ncbi:transcriptional regulatory protein ZraR [bacterium BMS3Bbin14]|nr:transcriptional regulatory protein ZraR [bacterium BMS3Abin13]GBE52162.1 transcriptional regulatory protein ZraR [bacterium BMS3Bbin14]
MVQMQGGNEVDYPGVISMSCQRSSCAVIERPAGRRGEDREMHLFVNNAINSTYCQEYYLKPSRIQDMVNVNKMPILIVDDDEGIRITFERFLVREGYGPIVTASNVAGALAAVREHVFDLVIFDFTLEGERGVSLLQQLREAGVDCPVVVITGFLDVDSASEIVRMGAFDYVPKPVNKQTLLRFTAQALRHRSLQNEKKRLVSENEQYRRYLEAVFRSVQDAIITVDADMNIIQFNKKAREWMLGPDRESQPPGMISDLHGELGDACREDALQVVNSRSEVNEHRIEFQSINEGKRVVSLNAAPVLDDSNAFKGVVLVAHDITTNGVKRTRDRADFHGYTDSSPAMQEVYSLIENVGKVDTTVLITGESGTGKELAAEALHAESPRRNMPLVKVDCASIPEELLESELFGHKKGAFTGADRDRTGRILKADGGTLFLDEIGDISPRMQLRLLRFLQEQTFYPVGQDKPVQVDVRLITATNADLKDKLKKGLFREDLYYRLRVVEVNLPPLRARREGLPVLINHFFTRFREKLGRDISAISDQAMAALTQYSWPGNVRELEHTIERACVLCTGSTLSLECLPDEITKPNIQRPLRSADEQNNFVEQHQPANESFPASRRIELRSSPALTRDDIVDALRLAGGNKVKAAHLLGIHRSTLYRKISRLRIAVDAT